MDSFKRLYAIAITSIFALILISQILIQRNIQKQSEDGSVINTAGKQRMLSQKLAKISLIIEHESGVFAAKERKNELRKTLDEWEGAHYMLQQSDSKLKLPPQNSARIKKLFSEIQSPFNSIRNAGRRLLNAKKETQIKDFVLIILSNEQEFLLGMDEIVKEYEIANSIKLNQLKMTEMILAILTIIILILEVWLVFRPTYIRLKNQRDAFAALNTELKAAQAKAEEIAKIKENFFSVVTHELRTPLNAIVGISDILATEEEYLGERDNIEVLQSSSKHLLSLVNDILDLSKMEAGALQFESTTFDIQRLSLELEQIFRLKASQKGLYLRFVMSENTPRYLVGDPVRLRQILTNLINNALKFTTEGGVTINISPRHISEAKAHLEFVVSDTGIGIPEVKQELIFEAFSQADSSTTRQYGGTGLGLAITRELVEKQMGSIRVESKEGVGSDFIFKLSYPFVDGKEIREEQQLDSLKKLNPEKLEGLRILIAEDDTMNQFVIKKLMIKWNVDFTMANNGKEALEHLLHDKPFDLVLMDFDMPEMNGLEATQHIRSLSNQYFQQIPIIAITASAIETVRNTLDQTGMNDYIPKPFYSDDLAKIILKYTHYQIRK